MNRKKSKTPTTDAILAHVASLGGSVRTRAAVLGIDHATLFRLERGDRQDALAMLDQMAAALGLRITVEKASDPA
jgi:transcriptional regulator with XRE-family HTH domain